MTERLKVIAGPMFSGKTDELIRLIERQEFAARKVQIFKPVIDNRWGEINKIRSHAGREKDAVPVKKAFDIFSLIKEDTEIVAIDEAQFFDEGIVLVVEKLLEKDIMVLVTGLPLDFKGEPFGPMPVLLAKADDIVKVTAICTHSENGEICGEEATRTQRFVDGNPADYNNPLVVIGAEEQYQPRCPNHHIVPGKPGINI